MDIKNCLNKRVVYATRDDSTLFTEGVVMQIANNSVNIGGMWVDINKVIVKDVLSDNINESGNGGEQLIRG
jgi:hypothetical protein